MGKRFNKEELADAILKIALVIVLFMCGSFINYLETL